MIRLSPIRLVGRIPHLLAEIMSNVIEIADHIMIAIKNGDIDTLATFARTCLGAGEIFDRGVVDYAVKLWEINQRSAAALYVPPDAVFH